MNPTRHKIPRKLWPHLALISTSLAFVPSVWSQAEDDEDILELSPFQVTSSERDIGYYAENTLAGSRMNTNVSDLAASITVVTRQQMEDTASLDINDIFRYEINTEGASTYTPGVLSMRNDGVADTIAGHTAGSSGSPQTIATANRMRGLGTPDRAINFYPSVSAIPMDSYNTQSVEINRGPNSMLFGMGSPAGIVNQSTARAQINNDATTVQVRVDDNGSFRASISANRSILDDKLAVYAALLYDDRQFQRKPSYDITRRQYAAATYRPFEKTTIRASFENYKNDNRRPNSMMPRDFVSEWNEAGQPIYDPTNLTVTKLATGEVVGPFIFDAANPYADQTRDYIASLPGYDAGLWNAEGTQYNGFNVFGEGALYDQNSPMYVPGITWTNNSRATMQIADGRVQNWFQAFPRRYRTQYGTEEGPHLNAPEYPTNEAILADPTNAWNYNQRWTSSTGWTATGINMGSYIYPGVTDSNIYNWRKVNISQANFGMQENQTYNIELEQEILSNLYFNAGWFRQDFESVSQYTIAQLNATTLFVDTNRYLPDGSPNPYMGQVYVEDYDPDQFVNKEMHDHYRAQIAWTPDFTGNDGWSRWLGRHQVMGLWSQQDVETEFHRNRWFFTGGDEVANGTIRYLSNPNDNPETGNTGWNYQTGHASARRAFYLGEPGGPYGRVTRSSGEWSNTSYTGNLNAYNFDRRSWEDIQMTQEYYEFDTAGAGETELESYSAGVTSHWWSDRLVTTFGVRKDEFKARSANNAGMTSQEKWEDGYLQTDRILNNWNDWTGVEGTTRTIGAVIRPFSNWDHIERRANSGNLWWEFVRDLGFSYNKSDNFDAPSGQFIDVFGNELPKPEGEGEDIGIQFSLFDRKLFARITYFEATNENEIVNPGTSLSRFMFNVDRDLFRDWARTIAMINRGHDPTSESWNTGLSQAELDAIEDDTAEIWGQPWDYYDTLPGSIQGTRSAQAQGWEAQFTYNPIENWTMKFTFGQQETKYSGVLKEFDEWYDVRWPVWENARASDYLLPEYQHYTNYTTFGGQDVTLGSFFESTGYDPNARDSNPWGHYNAMLYYNDIVAPQVALATDLEGQAAPGQRKYRWSYITNYLFTEGPMTGFSFGGALRWEDEAIIGYHGRSSGANADPTYMDVSDVNRPIYDESNLYTDLWVGYTRRIMDDKVRMKLQLNVANAFEGGSLRVVGVNFDGSPHSYRIIDPRQFILTATFDF